MDSQRSTIYEEWQVRGECKDPFNQEIVIYQYSE